MYSASLQACETKGMYTIGFSQNVITTQVLAKAVRSFTLVPHAKARGYRIFIRSAISKDVTAIVALPYLLACKLSIIFFKVLSSTFTKSDLS